MSDIRFTVLGMTALPRRYDVTITVDKNGGGLRLTINMTI